MRKTKKRFLSALLACAMLVSLFPFTAFAEDAPATSAKVTINDNATQYDSLSAALEHADNGDTLHISEGTLSWNKVLIVPKTVNIIGAGADKTVLKGQIEYNAQTQDESTDKHSITVEGITLQPSQSESNNQGLEWNNRLALAGYSLNVNNCVFDGWKYAIGVNSSATNCTLNVSNTDFKNTMCGMGVAYDTNKIGTLDNVTTTEGAFAVQAFEGNGSSQNGYYYSVDSFKQDPDLQKPDVNASNSSDDKPTLVWPAEAKVGNDYYGSLADAVKNAPNGQTITLLKDVVLNGQNKGNNQGLLQIDNNKTLTIDGNGYTISAKNVTATTSDNINYSGPSMINIQGNANVTVKNLVIDGGATTDKTTATKHGLNVYQAAVTVENVTIKNGNGYAIVANGSNATVNGLTTENNGWGGINVDNKSGNASLVVNSATIKEQNSIKFEKGNTAGNEPSGTINGGNFQYVTTGDDVDLNLLVNGGTFATGDYTGAVDINGYLAPGMTINPSTGEVYEIPPYTGKYSYAINVANMDNGSVSVDKYATEGEKVTLTVTPDKAYKLDELTVTANGKDVELTNNGDGTYTFTMPSSNVKVSASFVEDKDYVEPDNSITVSMTIGSNDFVINNNIVTVPDAAPYIANDRTYVPFRALGEALGAKVVWDNDARTVTYTLGDTTIVMTIGDTTYTINGVEKSMDVAPEITGDRTYVPVRFVAEGLGFKVTPLYADNGTTTSVVFEQ